MTARAPQAGIMAAYRRRRQDGDDTQDSGYIIIIVLVLAMIILSVAGVAMQASETNLTVTGSFTSTTQSKLASESGLNVATAKISAVTSLTPAGMDANGNALDSSGKVLRNDLPASLTTTNISTGASYTTTIQYYDASGNAFDSGLMPPSSWPYSSQAASIWPAKAVLTSVGSATNGATVKVVQSVSITPPSISVTTGGVTTTSTTTQVNQVSTTTTTLLPGYGEAIFSNGQVALSGNVSATTSAVTSPANIVAGGGIVCPNNVVVQGSIYSYSTSDQNLSNNCSISGGLYSASGITLSNSVSIGGDIWSYGAHGITLNNSVKIGGQAVATKGSITVNGSANVVGNATAAGAVNYNTGSQSWYGTIGGAVTQNSTTVGSDTMTAEPAFPALSDPTQAQWQATEYKNVITVTNAGTFLNGVQTSTTQTCSTYFAAQYLAPTYTASASQFNLDVNNATSPTAIDASACSAPNLYGPNGTATYSLKTDIALVVSGLQTSATNTFTSSSSTTHNLSIIVPAPGTGSITLSNATTFATSVNTLMYTEGTFAAANAAVMNGQILAATSATGSNNFALTFSSSAALTLPGTTTTTTTTSSAPTTPAANPPGTTSSSTSNTQTSGTTTTTTTVTTVTYPTGANSVTTTVVTTTPTSTTTSTTGSVSTLNRFQSR